MRTRPARSRLLLLPAMLLCAACGRRGPLELPPEPVPERAPRKEEPQGKEQE